MNHLLQSICPTEENARSKPAILSSGKLRLKCSRARKRCSQKGTRTSAWAMRFSNRARRGNSNEQRIAKDGKQHANQKRHQLRSTGLLGSGCLLRAARRMVWTAYRTRASACVLLCRSSLRSGMCHAFHAGNAQERLGPCARHWSNRHICIRHRLAFGNRTIGRRRPYQLHRVCPYRMFKRHKRSSTGAVPYVPCAKTSHFRSAHGSFYRLRHSLRFAIFACPGCLCGIPRLRCGVLSYKASLRPSSNRPINNRFKAPSRKNRIIQ